jgi:hypothetical protein
MKGLQYREFGTPRIEEVTSENTFEKDHPMSADNMHTPANSDLIAPLACREVNDSFPELLDADLPQNRKKAIEAHITSCEECQDAYRSYKHVVDCAAELGRSDEIQPVDVGVQNRLRKALNQRLGLNLSYIA